MRAEKLLCEIRQLKLRIEAEKESIARMRALVESEAAAMDSVGAAWDWRSELVLRIVDAERETAGRIVRLKAMQEQIRQQLAGIALEKYRTILRLRYIDLLSWLQIADKMGISMWEARRMHNAAVISFDEILECCDHTHEPSTDEDSQHRQERIEDSDLH